MSSKRDLVEAHAFNRRRLITAFVSGSPGGREVEPVRYGRTLVGGLVLAVLLVAGAAVSGLIKPAVPKDWLESGLVIGKSSGSRFVASNGTLFPVINTTSARLLSQDGELKVDFVPDDKIKAAKQGTTIGIQGAPDVLPDRSRLLPGGWTACTSQGRGISLNVSAKPGVSPALGSAFRVTSDGDDYVIAGNRRYAIPSGDRADALLRPFRLDQAPAREVSGRWLDLVPPGSPWKTFDVDGQGTSVDTGVRGLTKVGRPVLVDGQPELLASGGKLVPLSEFAYTLYRSSGPGSRFGDELKLSASDVRALKTSESRPYPSDWPTDKVQPYTSLDAPCLQLTHAESSGAPVVSLVSPSPKSLASSGSEVVRRVDVGRGALVESASGGVIGSGRTFLVDATGQRYALGTGKVGAATQKALGYGDAKPAATPPSWLSLFGDGPALSARAAAQPATQ